MKRKPRSSTFGAASERNCTTGLKTNVQLCISRKTPPGPAVKDHNDVCRIVRGSNLGAQDRENFVVFHLDSGHRIIGSELIARGSIDGVEAQPREVFKAAVAGSTKAIILAHNHPSGREEPSRQDIELTSRLKQAGELLGIEVLDHVVTGPEGFCTSMRSRGSFFGATGGYRSKR
jgi:DNA repair protein RadC